MLMALIIELSSAGLWCAPAVLDFFAESSPGRIEGFVRRGIYVYVHEASRLLRSSV
jgi:hypothetical protein